MTKYFALFGGGGIRGISYCGAYRALQENNIEITGCAGSSIGAVFATLLSLKYTYEEIFEIISDTGLGIFSDLNFDIKKDIAFSKGQKFYEWIKHYIEKKYYKDAYIKDQMPPVKFCDIEDELIVYAVDLSKMKFKEFSKNKTPDSEIAFAVRASVSMPGLFTPLIGEDNSLLVDGDLLKSAPLWRVSDTIKNHTERILEFRLEDTAPKENISNPIEYINRVYNAFCGFATEYIIDMYGEKDKFDYIKIDTPDISVVDFLISKQKKQELFDIGYSTTDNYIKTSLKDKYTQLCLKYKNLLKYLINFQKKLLKKEYCSGYICLCELFVSLCEQKRYIDRDLYERLVNLKDLYFQNYIKSSIFNFNRGGIKDKKEEIYNLLISVINKFSEKIEELS